MPRWSTGLRGVVGILVRIVMSASLLASLLFILAVDVYGILTALGWIQPWGLENSLGAQLGIYAGVILVLGAVWYFRTIVLRQPIVWWEEMCDSRSTRWISFAGVALVAVSASVLVSRVPAWNHEVLLFAIVTGVPLLISVFRGPRWWLVRPGREQQDLFQIARWLVPNAPEERQLQVAQLLYLDNLEILRRVAGPFAPENELLHTLPAGLTLRIPHDL